MKTLIATMLCTTVAALLSTSASATTVNHQEVVNAAGVCSAAFSNQTVRNRPTGVRNTGTSAIYVTCSIPGDFSGATSDEVYLRVANFGTSSQPINCNFQPGYSNGVTNTTSQGSFSGGATVAANDFAYLYFYSVDYPSTSSTGFYNANFTCLLQPNTELQYIGRYYDESVNG